MSHNPRHLHRQLCFLFYVSSKEVIKKYTAHLKQYNLTYTGYITLISIGDEEILNIKQLGDRIYLNSGTLTPLIKKLVSQGLVEKVRDTQDERNLKLSLTDSGKQLKQQLKSLSENIYEELSIEDEDMMILTDVLGRFIDNNFPHTKPCREKYKKACQNKE
ncbi:MarR family winged helix-turn-helix transcriptional regulator [Staphylococcus sp. 17KM0847]|uniref:MarR family winged helix-turn-helix transcriptional regulator n=1 Tax=Staphylococcus sp. 17KM0847 TaxID=2583989 RepID=UPI0015DBF607|nr:MarR family transcriptional regulator [Staphylococcus sp. 17KM0847]QLK86808.1 MarR family transcriptional regulator [Staphylococcus sp. 17KM0847]